MKIRILLVAGATVVSAVLLLGACSSSDHTSMDGSGAMPGSTGAATSLSLPADADFNATDIAFAQGIIPHHTQAVVMADMALDQSTDPQVIALATAIKAAQAPEIDQLTAWLEEWGQPVPDSDGMGHEMGAMEGMDGMMMSGMMSDADMARLENTTGLDFDQMWLEMMIQHHEGAVDMADQELDGGMYEPTTTMAQRIVTSQQAEIDTMEQLVAAMPA